MHLFKKAYTAFLLLFSSVLGYSQTSEEAIGAVNYTFMHQRDTSSAAYYMEDMSLMFGRSSSVYLSQTRQKSDSAIKAKIEQQLKEGGHMNLGRVNTNYTKQNYYHFFSRDLAVIESPFLSDLYIFNDTVPRIKWTITGDTKTIGGYNCQKATGYFAGRQYEAWFSPDLAVNTGPWKLSGLPGLILEATDSKQQIKFLFKEIYNLKGSGQNIAVPATAIKTTRADFRKMVKAYSETPEAFNNSGLDVKVTRNTSAPAAPRMNNPMELSTENK